MSRETVKWKRNLVILVAIVSLLVVLFGLCLIVAGVFALRWTRGGGGELVDPRNLDTSAAILAVVGCLTVLLGVAGILVARSGVTVKNVSVLAVFLLAAIFLDLSAGSIALIWRSRTSSHLVERTLEDIRLRYGHYEPDGNNDTEFYYGKNQVVTDRIDVTQEKLHCCGSASPLDYVGSRWYRNLCGSYTGQLCGTQSRIPTSCCPDTDPNDASCSAEDNSTRIYQEGCAVVIRDFVTESSKTVAWPSFVLAFLMLLCWCLKVFALVYLQVGEKRHRTVKALTFSTLPHGGSVPPSPECSPPQDPWVIGASRPTSHGVLVHPTLAGKSSSNERSSLYDETHL